MTKTEFFQWLKSQDCDIIPREGINNTSPIIELVNKKTKSFAWFPLSKDEQVPRKLIQAVISRLGIEPPANF